LAFLKRDDGVFAADVAVGDLQLAFIGPANVKGRLKSPGLHVARIGPGVHPENWHGTHRLYLAIC
jgi:hypothetical protein